MIWCSYQEPLGGFCLSCGHAFCIPLKRCSMKHCGFLRGSILYKIQIDTSLRLPLTSWHSVTPNPIERSAT